MPVVVVAAGGGGIDGNNKVCYNIFSFLYVPHTLIIEKVYDDGIGVLSLDLVTVMKVHIS